MTWRKHRRAGSGGLERSQMKMLVFTVLMGAAKSSAGAKMMLASAKYHGIDVEIIDGSWTNPYDAKLVQPWKELKYRTGYSHIIFADGVDTIFATGLGELHHKFGRFNHPFVIAGEHFCWPFPQKYTAATPLQQHRFRNLNSGFWMATWDGFHDVFSKMLAMKDDGYGERGRTISNDDQGRFYRAWMEGVIDVRIDHECHLSQCLAGLDERWSPVSRDMLWGKRPQNKITKSFPCTFHCNGAGEKWRLKGIYAMTTL